MRSERLAVGGEGADCRSLAAHFRCEHEYKINKLVWLLARYHFGVVINCVRFESDSLASSYRPYLSRKVEASFRRSLTVNPEKLVLVDLDGMVAGEYLSMYSPAAAGSEVLHFVVVQVSGITQRLSGDKKFSDGFFCSFYPASLAFSSAHGPYPMVISTSCQPMHFIGSLVRDVKFDYTSLIIGHSDTP